MTKKFHLSKLYFPKGTIRNFIKYDHPTSKYDKHSKIFKSINNNTILKQFNYILNINMIHFDDYI